MKIALLGYGKMGKEIEKIAIERGHEIVVRKTIETTYEGLLSADVAIEFSIPEAAVSNITACMYTNIPVVSGTTGWLEDYEEMVDMCRRKDGALLYSSNFSMGVNIFFELNEQLAKMMSKFSQYKVAIEEIHHTEKLDSPSGTAITLAKAIIENSDYSSWGLAAAKEDEILIEAKRIGDVPGTHAVVYNSDVDSIEIKHVAHNRQGFALGAVIAAEWIVGKRGVFSMKDVLNN